MTVGRPGVGTCQFRNDSQWAPVHAFPASLVMTSDLHINGQDDIVLSLPDYGLWACRNSTICTQIDTLGAEAVVEGENKPR